MLFRKTLPALLVATVVSSAVVILVTFSGAENAGYTGGTGGFLLPTMPLLVLSVSLLVLLFADRVTRRWAVVRRSVAVLSEYSLGIYILHPLVMFLPGKLMEDHVLGPGVLGFIGFVVLGSTTLALTVGIVALVARSPIAWTMGVVRGSTHPPALRKM